MKETFVADRYSRALFLALEEQKSADPETVLRKLSEIAARLASDAKLRSDLSSQVISPSEKKKILKERLSSVMNGCPPVLIRFLDIVIDKKRAALLPVIVSRFEQALQDSRRSAKAFVRSAAALDDRQKKAMQQKLSEMFGKKIEIESSVSPELIAGLVVQVGDTVIDNTLKSQLTKIKSRFEYGH